MNSSLSAIAGNLPMMKVLIPVLLVSLSFGPSHAQSVRVTADEIGQGFMFRDEGTCWVLMPKHLLDAEALIHRIEVETSPAPSLRGEGRAYAEFWEDMDLAIGYVGQEAGSEGCSERLGTVTQTRIVAGRVLGGALRVVLEGGSVLQYPMRIVDMTDHKTFVAEYLDPAVSAQKGRSGAFLFAGDLPIGMAIKAGPDNDTRQQTFIRIEELGFAARQWLAGRARALIPGESEDTQTGEDAAGYSLGLIEYDTAPVSPDKGPANLADGRGAYVFDFSGSTTLTFSVADGTPVGVSRVRVVTNGDGAKPLRIRVMIDAGSADRPNPQRFAQGQMNPEGVFDTGERGERFARRVVIAIDSVQGQGPVRIDRIEVY